MLVWPPQVLRWPAAFDKTQDLLIVAVDTPQTPIRDAARQRVRAVLREILGDSELISTPGQPIRLARLDSLLGISVSHEAGLSLLAIYRAGPVGIDLLRVPPNPDWQSHIPALANDYLGPHSVSHLAALRSSEQAEQFARAWADHEARLKCLGLALTEWSTELAARLSPCQVQQLALPGGFIGAVATLKSAGNPAA